MEPLSPFHLSQKASSEAEACLHSGHVEDAIRLFQCAGEHELQLAETCPADDSVTLGDLGLSAATHFYKGRQYDRAIKTAKSFLTNNVPSSEIQKFNLVINDATKALDIQSFVENSIKHTRTNVTRYLKEEVAKILETFRATSAWLFLPEGDFLVAHVIQNGNPERNSIPLGAEKSIIAHVAKTRTGDCVEDVRKEPKYLELMPGTRSELAVPVVGYDGAFLGVLNLESRSLGYFNPCQIRDLSSAATSLAPYIRLLASLNKHRERHSGWDFRRHGWSVSQLLTDLCFHICETLSGPATNMTCTVWMLDPEKDHIYVLSTAGFDTEYLHRLSLPVGSFTGGVMRLPMGSVERCHWKDRLDTFVRRDKAEQMGLTWLISAPIYLPISKRLFGALNIYSFAEEPHLPDTLVLHLVDIIGDILEGHESIQAPIAAEYCASLLKSQPLSTMQAFEMFKNILVTCLTGDGCSIFGRLQDSRKLVCVSTTGLERDGKQVNDISRASYDLTKDPLGMTLTVAKNPNKCIRKNDVPNPVEKSHGLNVQPSNKFRERFAMSDTDHRRFIGISVSNENDLLGVVRLNRSSNSTYLLPSDEKLLAELTLTSRTLFQDWRKEQQVVASRHSFAKRGLLKKEGSKGDILRSCGNLIRPLSGPTRFHAHATQVLQDILVAFKHHNGILASLREVVKPSDKEERLDVRAFHSTRFKDPWGDSIAFEAGQPYPLEQRPLDRKSEPSWQSSAWLAVDNRKVITFDKRKCPDLIRPIHQDSKDVVAGVCIPFVTFSARSKRCIKWVFCLDCKQTVNWGESEFLWLFYAAHKLATIASEDSIDYNADALTVLPSFARNTKNLFNSDWLTITFPLSETQHQTIARLGDVPRNIGKFSRIDGPLGDIGLEAATSGENQWRLNVRCGPSDGGYISWGTRTKRLNTLDTLALPLAATLTTCMNLPYLTVGKDIISVPVFCQSPVKLKKKGILAWDSSLMLQEGKRFNCIVE